MVIEPPATRIKVAGFSSVVDIDGERGERTAAGGGRSSWSSHEVRAPRQQEHPPLRSPRCASLLQIASAASNEAHENISFTVTRMSTPKVVKCRAAQQQRARRDTPRQRHSRRAEQGRPAGMPKIDKVVITQAWKKWDNYSEAPLRPKGLF